MARVLTMYIVGWTMSRGQYGNFSTVTKTALSPRTRKPLDQQRQVFNHSAIKITAGRKNSYLNGASAPQRARKAASSPSEYHNRKPTSPFSTSSFQHTITSQWLTISRPRPPPLLQTLFLPSILAAITRASTPPLPLLETAFSPDFAVPGAFETKPKKLLPSPPQG